MKKSLLTILGLSLLLFGVAGFALIHAYQFKIYSVQTDGMAPALQRGDIVITRATKAKQLRVNDIISYHSPAQPRVVITHRLVAIDTRDGLLIAKGDNSAVLDARIPVAAVIGKATNNVPWLGYATNFWRTVPGLVVCCYLPTLLLVGMEIKEHFECSNDQFYRSAMRTH